MDRREFLEASTLLAGGALLGQVPAPASAPPMLGIQIGAVSFVDEGTDAVLDSLREMAAINTLFVASFTYGRGIAGRQLPNQPLPDHGRQEYDTSTFHGGNHGGSGAGGRGACFCQYCAESAKKDGINVDRAKEGYTQLGAWIAALGGGQKPADGAFVTFWRLLVKYPEIVAWERLWNEGLNDTYRDMYRRAHEIAPAKGIGWHIWHNNSFSPFYRAEPDYSDFSRYP